MPCEILFKTNTHGDGTVDYIHPDPDEDKWGVYKKGYPVEMIDDPRSFRGYEEGLPYFCAVRVTDAIAVEVEAMITSTFSETSIIQDWTRRIDFVTVNNNLAIDGWRIRVFATNPGSTNFAGITRPMVEGYLNRWYASVFSVSTNEVVFDVAIFEDAANSPGALQSEGFWGITPVFVFFNEISYVEGTGVHTVEADYTASVFTSKQVQRRITKRGGVVVSDVDSVVVFTINRTDVFQWFQEELREFLERTIYCRQFRIPETAIDAIILTGTQILVDHYDEQSQFRGQIEYRVLDRTLVQVESFLINKLDEVL